MVVQVLLSVIDTTLSDSQRTKDGEGQEGKDGDWSKDGDRSKDTEVWSVVSETLDSFLFSESKAPQVR